MSKANTPKRFLSVVFPLLTCVLLTLSFLTLSCRAFTVSSEDEALKAIREYTRDGGLPPESLVADIETRFARTKTGALAKILRSRIRLEAGDFAGAASILEDQSIVQKTNLADYVLWLRGRSLQGLGEHERAMGQFSRLLEAYPDSLRAADAKVMWATSAVETGRSSEVPTFLAEFVNARIPSAELAVARAHIKLGNRADAVGLYRRLYFFSAGTKEAKEAESALTAMGQSLQAETAEEMRARADGLLKSGDNAGANAAYSSALQAFPEAADSALHFGRMSALVALRQMAEARIAFDSIPKGAKEKEAAYARLAAGHVRNGSWAPARAVLVEFAAAFPGSELAAKAFVDAGIAARDAKNKIEESQFMSEALRRFPESPEVASAQFELAWIEHEAGRFETSWLMFVEHLARYSVKNSSFRGRAGYWAARDAQRAGRIAEACVLYEALIHRYSANWYGYLASERLNALNGSNSCQSAAELPLAPVVRRAAENLKVVAVVPETSTSRDRVRVDKSSELSLIGLFDWSLSELQTAQRTAGSSPTVSRGFARHHRLKGDNVSAFLALAKTFPDYSQMFPEEMAREDWDIFYPLTHWKEIKYWSERRGLDPFKVAGLIRQESVFNPRARSSANAFGLMQLLVPTARLVAKKYNSSVTAVFADNLYDPALNIELGTAYMKDQLDNYGRIEYMAAAYNAGPGRLVTWRRTLPLEIDEFVEEIPFRETRMYVQGIIRNTAQYRRLYDENGNFRPNVGVKAGGRQRVVSN